MGLIFYKYYPLYKTFLEELGFEVVVSGKTTKEILNYGVKLSLDEFCFPLKVFIGHTKYLVDKVDWILVPRIISISNTYPPKYTCPKTIGLTAVINSIFGDDVSILEVEVNLTKKSLQKSFIESFKKLGKTKREIIASLSKAIEKQNEYERLIKKGLPYSQAVNEIEGKKNEFPSVNQEFPQVGLVGHFYVIFDDYINLNIHKKLSQLKVTPITHLTLDEKVIEKEVREYTQVSWVFEREIIGGVSYFLRRSKVKGVIVVIGFPCGPGAVLTEIIQQEVKPKSNLPLLILVIDEHTGDAGMRTRLESFVELIRR